MANVLLPSPGGGIDDIFTRGCAYGESNSNQKMDPVKIFIQEIGVMHISYPRIWDQNINIDNSSALNVCILLV